MGEAGATRSRPLGEDAATIANDPRDGRRQGNAGAIADKPRDGRS